MRIGKYNVRWDFGNVWQSVKDAARILLELVYYRHHFHGGDTLVVIGPLTFTWKP